MLALRLNRFSCGEADTNNGRLSTIIWFALSALAALVAMGVLYGTGRISWPLVMFAFATFGAGMYARRLARKPTVVRRRDS